MKLEEMLGIQADAPRDRHADELVSQDSEMLDALVAIAREKGLSQTAIADAMGVSPSSVSRIESGERDPHLSTLRRYAMAVGAVVHHEVRPFERDAVRNVVEASLVDEDAMLWAVSGEYVDSAVARMVQRA